MFDLEASAFNWTKGEYDRWAHEKLMVFAMLHEELCAALDLEPKELDFFEAERSGRDLPEVPLGTRGLWDGVE